MDRGNIVKTSLLHQCQRFALLALLVLAASHPAQAASKSFAEIKASTPPLIQLAWDRVGSPIQIRA